MGQTKPSNNAVALLVREFMSSSSASTTGGNTGLWTQLERAGYVKPLMAYLPGRFTYEITDAGREAIAPFMRAIKKRKRD